MVTTTSPASSPATAPGYQRRRPEEGTLHRVVRENVETLYAAAAEGFPLPCRASSAQSLRRTSTVGSSIEASP